MLDEWLPEGHLAWFIIDAVEQLDLAEFRKTYRADGRGGAAHDPSMMVALLLYAYSIGVVSSRKIETACQVDVAFRVVTGNLVPDHTTISRFRATHAEALAGLFTQVLFVCAEAGLVNVGTIAVDGTKMKASASLDANRSLESITRQVNDLLGAAEAADAAEDAALGDGVHGDKVPDELRDRSSRRARLAAGRKLRGRKPKAPGEKQKDRGAQAKVNTTDPESRIMPTRNGWVQGCNAQAVVTEEQIIIAAQVSQDTNDAAQLAPMIDAADRELVAAGIV